MSEAPAPNPSGYQPAPGEGITSVTVSPAVSRDYQKAAIELTYTFPQPVAYTDAVQPISELWDIALEECRARLDQQVADVKSREQAARQQAVASMAAPAPAASPAPAAQVPAPAAVPAPASGGLPPMSQWPVAQKPNSKGDFRYLPSTVVSSEHFKAQAEALAVTEGFPAGQFDVWDDRVGKYGLESGNTSYAAGKAKPKDGTPLAIAAEGKVLASFDFNADGTLKIIPSGKGKEALAALRVQAAMQQQAPTAPTTPAEAQAIAAVTNAFPPPPSDEVPF